MRGLHHFRHTLATEELITYTMYVPSMHVQTLPNNCRSHEQLHRHNLFVLWEHTFPEVSQKQFNR